MDQPAGLRERKKLRTRAVISGTAIELFLAHGFDQVSVAQVAAEAEVSKRTLFAYFPSKEDLVLHRFADHEENAWVVRARWSGQSPLDALREHVLDGLRRRDPITGLNDDPQPLALLRMVSDTPSLAGRVLQYLARSETALTIALAETPGQPPGTARILAAAVTAVLRALAEDNARQLTDGESAAARHPHAVAAVERAFALLTDGFGNYSG